MTDSMREWELEKDRELDQMTDEQLRYLHSAIAVTLDDRAASWFAVMNGATAGGWRVVTPDAIRGPFATIEEAKAAMPTQLHFVRSRTGTLSEGPGESPGSNDP